MACTNVGIKVVVVARVPPHVRLPAGVARASELTVGMERMMGKRRRKTYVVGLMLGCIIQ
ncbi:hypothetical protein Hanom_Chr06g00559691 [Helianthus anomalus]